MIFLKDQTQLGEASEECDKHVFMSGSIVYARGVSKTAKEGIKVSFQKCAASLSFLLTFDTGKV